MDWKNKITDILGIEYPIIQAPMYGVSTSAMLKSASEIGCLGSLALGDLNAEQCSEKIREVKKLTDKNFVVNLFINDVPEITPELKRQYNRTKNYLETLTQSLGWNINFPEIETVKPDNYQSKIETLILENCKILSFTFGNLDEESIAKLKSHNVTLIGTCTSLEEALALEKSGIDIICVQGLEAGGHRGSFGSENIPKIGGFALLSEISQILKTPLIYGGGIRNAKTLLAAKTLGAQGFQVGTTLLCSAESALKDFEKERLYNLKEHDIILTKSFSGRYARGINNQFIKDTEHSDFILPYPYQNKLTQPLRNFAKQKENVDLINIWVGQAYRNLSKKSTSDILKDLISETESLG